MIIIADSSALVALSTCEALFVLKKLFGNVFVPFSVYQECVIENKSQAKNLQHFLHDKIKNFEEDVFLNLPANLGEGEIAAMRLYKKMNANCLLIDDNRARKIAKHNQINIVGSLGVLLLAKQENIIKKITPFLDKLENSNLYIAKKLLLQIKKLAGE